MRPFPKRETPMPVIVLFRWLIFRIMFGAGGSNAWGCRLKWYSTLLSLETQPLMALSRWFHFAPFYF
jgi:hypothetical protein